MARWGCVVEGLKESEEGGAECDRWKCRRRVKANMAKMWQKVYDQTTTNPWTTDPSTSSRWARAPSLGCDPCLPSLLTARFWRKPCDAYARPFLHRLRSVPCAPGAWPLPVVIALRLIPVAKSSKRKQGGHTRGGGADGGAVCCAQTDKKTLNTKVMMQEMKEIREKRRSAETTAKAVSVQTPFVFPLNPDITLNCQDECGCSDPPPPPPRVQITVIRP